MGAESYNGWTNYATWNVNLWLSNDEPLYRAASAATRGEDDADAAGDHLKAIVSEFKNDRGAFGDCDASELETVNWAEIGAAWIED